MLFWCYVWFRDGVAVSMFRTRTLSRKRYFDLFSPAAASATATAGGICALFFFCRCCCCFRRRRLRFFSCGGGWGVVGVGIIVGVGVVGSVGINSVFVDVVGVAVPHSTLRGRLSAPPPPPLYTRNPPSAVSRTLFITLHQSRLPFKTNRRGRSLPAFLTGRTPEVTRFLSTSVSPLTEGVLSCACLLIRRYIS